MNTIPNVISGFKLITSYYPTSVSLAGGVLAGSAAVNIFLHIVLKDIPTLYRRGFEEKRFFKKVGRDLGWITLYALLALNLIPHSASIGGTVFIVHSLIRGGKPTGYLLSQLIHKVVELGVRYLLSPIVQYALTPGIKWLVEVLPESPRRRNAIFAVVIVAGIFFSTNASSIVFKAIS